MKCWQLLPYNGYEWGLAHQFQVSDTVSVISPTLLEYHKKGKVCGVTNLGVKVWDHRTQAMVCPYFGHPFPALMESHVV
jgi:hypothetical protein